MTTINKLRIMMATFAVLVLGLTAIPAMTDVSAQSKEDICAGVGLGSAGCGNTAGAESDVSGAIATAINLFSIAIGIVAVIFIMIGGLKYITASGDSNATTSARNTVLFALIGLGIAALAQIVVRFVLNRIT